MPSSKKDNKTVGETKYRKLQKKRKTTKLKYKLNDRLRRPLLKQFEKMVEILERHEYAKLTRNDRKQIWTQLANELNAFGLHKSPQKWRKTFSDWKHSIKKKISDNRNLTECEQKVFKIFLDQRNDEELDDYRNDSNDEECFLINGESKVYASNENSRSHLLQKKIRLDRQEKNFDKSNRNAAVSSDINKDEDNCDDADEPEASGTMQIVECKPEINLYNGIESSSSPCTMTSTYSGCEDLRSIRPTQHDEDVDIEFGSFHNNIDFIETNKNMKNGNKIANQINELNQRLPNSNISAIATNVARQTMPLNRVSIGSTLETLQPPPLISINNPNKKFPLNEPESPKNHELAARILEKVTNLETYFCSIDCSLKKIALSMEFLVKK